MKIRTDFVTNSSSSSYIIAYKSFVDDIDKKTLENYPVLNKLEKLFNIILTLEDGCRTFKDISEYQDYLINCLGYIDLEDVKSNKYATDKYNKVEDYINKGYSVVQTDIPYDYNSIVYGILKVLKDDKHLIIIEKD